MSYSNANQEFANQNLQARERQQALELLGRARQLMLEGHYEQALSILDSFRSENSPFADRIAYLLKIEDIELIQLEMEQLWQQRCNEQEEINHRHHQRQEQDLKLLEDFVALLHELGDSIENDYSLQPTDQAPNNKAGTGLFVLAALLKSCFDMCGEINRMLRNIGISMVVDATPSNVSADGTSFDMAINSRASGSGGRTLASSRISARQDPSNNTLTINHHPGQQTAPSQRGLHLAMFIQQIMPFAANLSEINFGTAIDTATADIASSVLSAMQCPVPSAIRARTSNQRSSLSSANPFYNLFAEGQRSSNLDLPLDGNDKLPESKDPTFANKI